MDLAGLEFIAWVFNRFYIVSPFPEISLFLGSAP